MPRKHNALQFSLFQALGSIALVAIVCKLYLVFGWIAFPVALVSMFAGAVVTLTRPERDPGFVGACSAGAGAIAGMFCASMVCNTYGVGREGIVIGAIAGESIWLFLNVTCMRQRSSSPSCKPKRRLLAMVKALCVFLSGPLLTVMVWLAMIMLDLPKSDWISTLVRLLSIGAVVGLFVGLPCLLVAIGVVE